MLIGSILQIIIALIFIYLISSLIVSELQEQFASLMEFRATNLRKAIDIFVGESIRKDLYEKTLLNSFNQFTNRKLLCIILLKPDSAGPSYIEPKIFAQSLMIYVNTLLKPYNKFTKDDLIGIDVGDFQTGILKKLKTILEEKKEERELMVNRLTEIAYSCKLKHDNPNFDHFLEEIALTFEQVLERTSGVYRRNAKGVSLILGIITAVLFNIDSFYILDQLYKNPDLTQEINQLANSVVEENKLCLTEGGIEDVSNSLNDEQKAKKLECDTKSIEDIKQIEQLTEKQITLPLGWKKNDSIFLPSLQESQNGLFAIFGWLITAVAIAMGAPFWFDLLGKVINVRNAGKSIGLTKDSKP